MDGEIIKGEKEITGERERDEKKLKKNIKKNNKSKKG